MRDVADLHLRAMTDPAAAGERFIAAGEYAWMADIAEILRKELGPQAAKVPTRRAPDLLIRLAAIFDRDLATVTPGLSRRQEASGAKAQRVLGWRPRAMRETVLDCARSLIAAGLV